MIYSVKKTKKQKKRIFFAALFHAWNIVCHCTSTRQWQTPCSTHHTAPCQQQRRSFSPRLPCSQNLTPTNTLGTSWRDVFETEWMPLQMCVSCFRHSSTVGADPSERNLQYDPVHASETLGSYWFSRRPNFVCVSLSRKYRVIELFPGREQW